MGFTLLLMDSFLYFQAEKHRASPAIKLITTADFSGEVTMFFRAASYFWNIRMC